MQFESWQEWCNKNAFGQPIRHVEDIYNQYTRADHAKVVKTISKIERQRREDAILAGLLEIQKKYTCRK